MDTLQTLIDKYTGIYTKTKRKIEKQLKATCTEEDKENLKTSAMWMIASFTMMPLMLSFIITTMMEASTTSEPINQKFVNTLTNWLYLFSIPLILAGFYKYIQAVFIKITSPEEKQELQKKLERLVSPDDINAALNNLSKGAADSCVVTKIPVCYKVSKKVYMSIEPVTIGNTPLRGFKAGEIRFTGTDLPPVLLSLRGWRGPQKKEELMQKYILGKRSEKFGKAKNAVYPCISEAVFNAFPDEVRMEAVCIDLFPDIMQGKWKFLIHNPEAYGEIETAVKMLCGAVEKSIKRNNLEARLQKAAKTGKGLYHPLELITREDLIDCFSRKNNSEESQLADAFTTTEATLIPTVNGLDISTLFLMSKTAAIENKNDELIIDAPSA